MMPFSKEKNRRIYITALVISFLLIVGSIYLHLKQKTHLGRMSFNLDREHIKPTSGVANSYLDDFDSISPNKTYVYSSIEVENDKIEASSPAVDDLNKQIPTSTQPEPEDDTKEEQSRENTNEGNADYLDNIMERNDKTIDDFADDLEENSEYEIRSLGQDSNACLRCLCMTVNECRPTFCGSGNPCGLYRISKRYWIDSGKPTIAGGSTDNEDQDYLTCVNEDTCAATVIRQYYNRYKRDCNKDGTFDCRDQIALHLLGPSGCLTDNLSHIHSNRMRNCLIESNLNLYSYSDEY